MPQTAEQLAQHRQKADRLPSLIECARMIDGATPYQWNAERAERYAAALAMIPTMESDADKASDAAVYLGRETIRNANATPRTLARFACHAAKQYAWNAADIEGENAPYSLHDDDLALDERAEIDADPQTRYRYTPAALVAELVPLTMERLRAEARALPALPEEMAPQQPARKIADRIERALAVRKATAEDRYALTLRYLSTAQRAAKIADRLNRSGWNATTSSARPMIGRAPLPNTGPASAIVTTDKEGQTTVEGMPWDEVRAALGMPEATRAAVKRAALTTLLHSASEDRPTIGGALLPPAEWSKAKRLEDSEDKRRHEARQQIKKPNPRKRPRGGRLGTSASIR
jgi:hypothetical protein